MILSSLILSGQYAEAISFYRLIPSLDIALSSDLALLALEPLVETRLLHESIDAVRLLNSVNSSNEIVIDGTHIPELIRFLVNIIVPGNDAQQWDQGDVLVDNSLENVFEILSEIIPIVVSSKLEQFDR